MPEACTELAVSFTTADTIAPVTLSYDGRELVASFANHGTPLQHVTFANARAFAWIDWASAPVGSLCDRVCEVVGSELLAPFARFSVNGAPFRHFRLGFNAEAKFLDVIATRMGHKEALG